MAILLGANAEAQARKARTRIKVENIFLVVDE